MQRNRFLKISLFLFFNILALSLFGQRSVYENWWFGNGANGIQFSKPFDTARAVTRTTTGAVSSLGNGGGAVASDQITGALLFYTDGDLVLDATHTQMPDGSGLGGNTSGNQPAVICRVPGSTTQYFVITNTATPSASGTISYATVDMALQGNPVASPDPIFLGNVLNKGNSTGLTGQSEAMVIVKKSGSPDYWLITKEFGTLNFVISTVSASGVTAGTAVTPGISATANPKPVGLSAAFSASNFSYDSLSNRLAVAPEEANRNVMLFDFDETTGTLSLNRYLAGSAVTGAVTPPAIFDTAWPNHSNDTTQNRYDRYFYVSRPGNGTTKGDILQYDLNNPTAPALVVPTPSSMLHSYGIQMGTDSSLYHLYQETAGGPILVGRIDQPDTIATALVYNTDPFVKPKIKITTNANQFPSFLVAPPPTVTLTIKAPANACSNTPVTFFPTVTPGADSIKWDFGDQAGTSKQWSPVYTYTTGGQSFTVTATAFADGEPVATASTLINVTDNKMQVSLVQDTVACTCQLGATPTCDPLVLTASASGGTPSYQWYGPQGEITGGNAATIPQPILTAGVYYVLVTDQTTGCVMYAPVNIREYNTPDPRSAIWHFGNLAGINFNPKFIPATGADPIGGPVTSPEGVSTISDENGQYIISTDGVNVYDRTGALIVPNPPGTIGGSTDATQSSLIVPVADDPTLFYIFITREVYPQPLSNPGFELRYTIFDLKQGTNGQLVDPDPSDSEISTPLYSKTTERLTGTGGWVISHEFGNNNFRAYLVSGTGIGEPVISSVGSSHDVTNELNARGYMKLGNNGILAVALPGRIEYFDFDGKTGAVSNFRAVDLPGGETPYGIEFSPGGEKMYVSTVGPASKLYEFQFDKQTKEYSHNNKLLEQDTGAELGAIQVGPDGTIYVAVNGASALGTISPNPQKDQPSVFTLAGFNLAGHTSTLGLPNFIQSITNSIQGPTIAAVDGCEDTPVTFTGSGRDIIDEFTWSFGDNTGQGPDFQLDSVTHTYKDPGTYFVTLTLKNRCDTNPLTLRDTVTINGAPTVQSGAVILCNGAANERMLSVIPADEQPGMTFSWDFGDTTKDPFPPDRGTFVVTVTTAQACSATGSWDVFDIRPDVELGPDQVQCQSSSSVGLDAGPNLNYTYVWTRSVNGAAPTSVNDTDERVGVSLSNPGAFEYFVKVTDPASPDPSNPCFVKDSVTITVNPSPKFIAVGIPPTSCGATDGQIKIDITPVTQTGGPFSYIVATSPSVTGSDQIVGASILVSNASAGNPPIDGGAYNVTLTDQVNGCSTGKTVGVNDNAAFTLSIDRLSKCIDPATPGKLPVKITTDAAGNYTYRILEFSTTNAAVAGGPLTGSPHSVKPGVTPGTYVIEITDGAGCTKVSDPEQDIKPNPGVPIGDIEVNNCAYPATLKIESSVSETLTYLWTTLPANNATDAGIVTTMPGKNDNGPEIELSTFVDGTYTFKVTVTPDTTTSSYCPNSDNVPVILMHDPKADITKGSECADEVLLTAAPTGSYVYRWTVNGTLVGTGNPILADATGPYRVEVINVSSGCSLFDTLQVNVLGELTVELSNEPPCEGTPYAITASSSQSTATFQWFLNPTQSNPGVISNESDSVLTVTDDKEGLFKVIASTGNGTCTAKDSVTIIVSPVTQGHLPLDGIICPQAPDDDPHATVQLNPGDEFISYTWYLNGDSVSADPIYAAKEVGTYTVKLINLYNCPSSDTIKLVEECDPLITGPNAFRPEGLNKEFSLFTFFIDENSFEIYIFNRWGEMIFYDNKPDFKWNGGYKNDINQPVPPGTYSYLVKYKSSYRPELGVEEYRGGVVLLR